MTLINIMFRPLAMALLNNHSLGSRGFLKTADQVRFNF
jgi:hypothetical protein